MKRLLFVLILLSVAVFCAGCVDDGGNNNNPSSTPVPTQAVFGGGTFYGTWYSQNTVEYTDPVYLRTDSYDIAVTFNEDGTGSELWTSVSGKREGPYAFTWMKDMSGAYTAFFNTDYHNQGYLPSKLYTLSYDMTTLMDDDANTYTKNQITHTPTPTPVPTQAMTYKTNDFEKLRGIWSSAEIVKSSNDKPCILQYTFNKDKSGVEIWKATQQEGNLFVYDFNWEQSVSGSYVLTMTKHIGGEFISEVHVLSFITPDYSVMMDERGYTYRK